MRIKPKQYVLALVSSLRGKNDKDAKILIANFCRLLADGNLLYLSGKIIEEFKRQWDRSEGLVNADVFSAQELDTGTLKNIEAYIAGKLKAKKVEIKKNVNPDLLGGVILKFEDKVFDGSVAASLKALKAEMKK